MDGENIIESLGSLEFDEESVPLTLNDFEAHIVNQILDVMQHSLGYTVALQKHSMHIELFHGLLQQPSLVQLPLDAFQRE